MRKEPIIYHYSHAFKQKVVDEIERGKYTMSQAKDIYNIGGGSTIREWIKKLGKNHLLGKVVRIEMKKETDKIKELKKLVQELKNALSDMTLKNLALQMQLEVIVRDDGIDVKKRFSSSNRISQYDQKT